MKLKIILVLCMLSAVLFTTVSADTDTHWAAEQIAELKAEGVMTGGADGFMPDRNITRAEFVSAVIRAIKAEPSGSVGRFSDVDKNSFYAPYIGRAVELGLVTGFADATFRPDSSITREEAVVVLSRAFGFLSGYTLGRDFSDYSELTDGAKGAVAYALKEKIISGYPDNTLRPRGTLTRAEAAVLILGAMNIEGSEPGFIMGYPRLEAEGLYGHMRLEISTNMPCTVYYVLHSSDMPGIPAKITITNPLVTTVAANKRVIGDIRGEIGNAYNISLLAVTPDGRTSNVVQLENVTPRPYTEGSGTAESPYGIYTAEQLDLVRFFPDKAFALKRDIMLSGEWEPIEEFYGSIDGEGHRIDGLYVDTDQSYAGLFGKIVKGEIKNLTAHGNVRAKSNAGIFAGELLDAKITSCVASGSVTAVTNNAGGFFGESAGRIENSLSAVYVVEASAFSGGIAGQNYGIIRGCISAAHTVTANMYAGGISSVNMVGGRIEKSVAANINVYDMMLDNCGRITSNKRDAVTSGNYGYSGMRTSSDSGVNEADNNNGADLGWEELIDRKKLCEILGWEEKLWSGGSKAESYLIPHPTGACVPRLTAGITEYAPVRISRAAELLGMITNPDMHYLLINDISFGGNVRWSVAADTLLVEEGFSGTFDGNGHTIRNLSVTRSQNGLCGLFGMISGGTVRNLRLEDVTLSGGELIGAVAAVSYGTIDNCIVENLKVTTDEADAYIGGICGYNYGTVTNTEVTGDIVSDVRNTVAGGITAHNEGFINNTAYRGSIRTSKTGLAESVVGGICGYNSGGMIYNAYAAPEIRQTATTMYSGGICAIQSEGELYKCSSKGSIVCDSNENTAVSYSGGISGLAAGGIVMHTFSYCDITQYTPRSYSGGICGYNEAAIVQNGYSGGSLLQTASAAFAGGICGYNEGGVVASAVAVNPSITSDGIVGRICAAGSADGIYSNYAAQMSIKTDGEGVLGGTTLAKSQLNYAFFTMPVSNGGALGWSDDIWVKSSIPTAVMPVLADVKYQTAFY
ncbi:MAG: S-layer homology domain-containing protein [Clostridia bacterium]|nr:S-layer homology domain-containing protein [Clostridia bacterium]